MSATLERTIKLVRLEKLRRSAPMTATQSTRQAELLSHNNPAHIQRTAQIIKNGGIVVFPFNGIYGLFGNIDDTKAKEKIFIAKNRPKDRKLIAVVDPDNIHRIADLSKVQFPISQEQLTRMWRKIHALGIILPAAETAPPHLVDSERNTIVNIWTEDPVVKALQQELEKLGVRGLVGTSANKSGQITITGPRAATISFGNSVDAIVQSDFHRRLQGKPYRFRSTSMVDFTLKVPYLERAGNVLIDEINEHLTNAGFPSLKIPRDFKQAYGPYDPLGRSIKTYRNDYQTIWQNLSASLRSRIKRFWR